jgi:hydroxyacylglutathione hydrolase
LAVPQLKCFTGGPFAENSWLVIGASGRDAVIVDPGAATGALLDELERSGAMPRAIVLTHGHIDHVEGIPAVRERYAELPIHLHRADRELYDHVPQQAAWFGMEIAELPEPDLHIEPGRDLEFGELRFEVAFAPGHAPGHVVLHMPEAGLALVGDVIFQGSVGRTDLPGGDGRQLLESIRREILTLPDATRLLPGHGPETTVARERASNPYLRGVSGPGS